MCLVCILFENDTLTKREVSRALVETNVPEEHRKEIYDKYYIERPLTNVELSGVDFKDAPDFVDAYISYAEWADSGVPLTEEELESIDPEVVYEHVINQIY
jgi:hypothetical protein